MIRVFLIPASFILTVIYVCLSAASNADDADDEFERILPRRRQ